MHSGSSLTPNNPAFSASIGIAALIIEGRPLFDDEYAAEINDELHQHRRSIHFAIDSSTSSFSSTASTSASSLSSATETPQLPQRFERNAYHLENRALAQNLHHQQQQQQSTSSSGHLASALTSTPTTSSAFVSKQDSIQHLERLRQKLHQLRASPSTSRDFAEHLIAVSADSPPPPSSSNETDLDHDEELEIIYKRRSSVTATATTAKDVKPVKPIALNSLHLLAASSLHRTPRSYNEHSGLLKAVESWTCNKFTPDTFSTPSTSSSSEIPSPQSPAANILFCVDSKPLTINYRMAQMQVKEKQRSGKVLGPHCEHFLNKIGLAKGKSSLCDHSMEFDVHVCKRNNTCFRWQQCEKQLVTLFTHGDPICIEVYLGPEHHAILLEQWIIQQNNEAARFSMTIQSLCTAIRSQLHFSQITAWSDLLKSALPFDNDLQTNPRIKNASNLSFKPKLDVLYRIRPYSAESLSCFSATPIEHNFPETMVSDQLSIKVSLKSLPRMKSIPKLYDATEMSEELNPLTATIQPLIVDDQNEFVECIEKGKHRCPFDEESPIDDATSHRDKQLLKYKKRLMRRDKKKRTDESSSSSSTEMATMQSKPDSVDAISRNSEGGSLKNATVIKQYDQTINPNKPPLYSSTMNVDTTVAASSSAAMTAHDLRSIDGSAASDVMVISTCIPLTLTKATQTAPIEMTSVATQTDNGQSIVFHNCDFCGIEMQYFCWNCDKRMFIETPESQTSLGKADLLLKAIQRTPSTKQQQVLNTKKNRTRTTDQRSNSIKEASLRSSSVISASGPSTSSSNKTAGTDTCFASTTNGNGACGGRDRDHCDTNSSINDKQDRSRKIDSNVGSSNFSAPELDVSDCRSCCKRQKTVHNYYRESNSSISNIDKIGDMGSNNDTTNGSYCLNTINNNDGENITNNNISNDYSNTKSNRITTKRSNNSSSYNSPIRQMSRESNGSNKFSMMPNITSYDDSNAFLLAKRDQLGECSGGNYRRTMSESVVGACHTAIESSTHPGIDLATCESMNILTDNELKLYRRAYSEDELICNCDDNRPKQSDLIDATNSPPNTELSSLLSASLTTAAENDLFKTPTSANQMSRTLFNHHQAKPIFIECCNQDNADECSRDSIMVNMPAKPLPKINLSKLFTTASSSIQSNKHMEGCSSSEIDVDAELQNIAQSALSPVFSLNNIFDFDNLSPPLTSPTTITTTNGSAAHIQKSNSAPTFQQHSPPTLSPRFLKSAAASKRRSRHLSDRSSERLSVGSDDHLSDEEFHQYCFDPDSEYRPGISPTKATLRLFPKNYAFRKRVMLGSFEESLLQRRFEPKFLVPGYKVLLGASGCYCTNQITIPAYTFFYEMNAETLSTPYVCEVSMPPRKGYVIPRTGHVQATLLNPNGMVVRMFVVAYDFRDMPAMCQTFVRQRILSFDENANPGKNVDDLSASEQMKLLRYAIHLRFQTTRSGRLALHSDIRMLISRRTDCDTAAAHAKGALESPSELKTVTIVPENPKFSPR